MLQVCEICKYKPLLSRILKYFATVFNCLSQVLRIYTYSRIYIKKSLLVNLQYACEKNELKMQYHSVVIASKKLRDYRGIISHLFISTVFYDNLICHYWFFFSVFFFTVWKVSKYGVIFGPYIPIFLYIWTEFGLFSCSAGKR